MLNKERTCAYCGEFKSLTRDHVPPKNLFQKPRPQNLITVPCCEDCRGGWSADDEYFRIAVTVNSNAEGNPSAMNNFKVIMRSLRKPGKWKFARHINQSLGHVSVQTPGGIYLGKAPAIKVQAKRIDRVAQRIIRGLFYEEFKVPVPEGYEVTNRMSQQGFGKILDGINPTLFKPWREIGNKHFAYTYAQTEEDPYSVIWLSVFYDALPFLGFTVKPKHRR